ncbi:DUF3237 domain-containing protein [Streptomyces sp. GS7]|uniref:DUF3237 domain-containing protein n=1 Tax=Streptomyces sp. GS7 TaxID=2692234 RepID=UPI0013169699|nr:DUF3237 domain-containing protein [Streptomyces sp. GS7]QHC23407.1 DUF3237 family protein [Streptomyces sp. GS7]
MKLAREMIYSETIDGPWGPTTGSPLGERLCWRVNTARLVGERIDATLVTPGMDWIRLGTDQVRRQDLRVTLATDDGEVIMLSYDNALIRESPAFLAALSEGRETRFDDQYMRMVAQFDTGAPNYRWLTQSLFIGEGRLAGPRTIEYQIYRLD